MAYASLVSLAHLLEQIMGGNEDCFAAHEEKQQAEYLHEKVVSLTTFLEEFPTEAGELEARITIAANQAEDIFEYHILNKNGPKYGKRRSSGLNCFRQVPLSPLEMLYKDLRKPINEIDSILKQVMNIENGYTTENQMSNHSSSSSSSELAPKGTVVGFEEDLVKIKGRLCGEPSKLQVIPIVGMGGIGKTTLARYVLDDPSNFHHFDVRDWVAIAQNSLVEALLGLLNSIDASTKEQHVYLYTEYLVERVYKYLKGRRYLIVIDDIWNANVWDDLQRAFPDDLNGSRIIMTTRDLDVVSYVDSLSHPHKMHLMDVDRSWNLLRQKVFAEEHCPPGLVEIGKLIAEKCGGLPLAIVVIAGVLSKASRMQEAWTVIARDVIEAVGTSYEPFSEVLSLSYARLPHHLRPCFLYLGSFPKDCEINVSKLTKLWAAEGFLKSNGSNDMEVVAEEYLKDLIKRSLILVSKKRYNGKVKIVQMHDLLRDLCIRKARDEIFFHMMCEFRGSFPEGIENSRRLSVLSNMWGDIPNRDGSRIHTILLFRHWAFDCWKSFRLLRVLDAMGVILELFPFEIIELLHLRYLAVKFLPDGKSADLEVPESLSKLQNLETLIIRIYAYICMPFGIWRMPKLRHLILLDGFLPDPSTKTYGQISALENLHTLKCIKDFMLSGRILELIPNLKKLGIIYSSWDIEKTGWSKFGLYNLIHLHKLEKLNISARPYDYSQSDLSKNIAFPMTLKKLTLRGSGIPWKDISIVGSLPNLEVLKLKPHSCHGFEWETTEGEFCQLKVLLIDNTDPHHWITESSHFPRLEGLRLYNCHTLTEIPDSIGEIPTLQLIELDSCNLSIVESVKRIEEEQCSFGNDLQVLVKTSTDWNQDMYPRNMSFQTQRKLIGCDKLVLEDGCCEEQEWMDSGLFTIVLPDV